jgi:hypothetical protein
MNEPTVGVGGSGRPSWARVRRPDAADVAFLMIGRVVFQFHRCALFGVYRRGLVRYYVETVLVVPVLAVIA